MSDTEATAQLAPTAEATPTPTQGAPASDTPPVKQVGKTGSDEVTFPTGIDALKAYIADVADVRVTKSEPAKTEPTGGEPAPETATAETVPPETTPEPEATPEAIPEGETEVEPEAGTPPPTEASAKPPPQYRLRPQDETEKLALSIVKSASIKGKPISLKDAIAQAETILKKDDTDPKGAAPVNHDKAIADAQAELDSLWTQHTKAYGEDLDFKKAGELLRQINTTDRRIASLQQQQIQEQAQHAQSQQQQRMQTFETSKVEAVKLYPDAAVDNSPLVLKIAELDERMREQGNPLANDPNKPLILAQMAANELRIAPKAKNAPVASKTVASSQPVSRPVPTAKPSVPLVSGTARTTQATPQGQLQAVLDGIKTPEDIYAFTEALANVRR